MVDPRLQLHYGVVWFAKSSQAILMLYQVYSSCSPYVIPDKDGLYMRYTAACSQRTAEPMAPSDYQLVGIVDRDGVYLKSFQLNGVWTIFEQQLLPAPPC